MQLRNPARKETQHDDIAEINTINDGNEKTGGDERALGGASRADRRVYVRRTGCLRRTTFLTTLRTRRTGCLRRTTFLTTLRI